MRAIVCGSQGWDNRELIFSRLSELPKGSTVITGGAIGADAIARQCSSRLKLQYIEYRPDWRRLGRRAGISRNEDMLDKEWPDLVIAFWDGISPGTKHMIDYAQSQGYTVEIHT